MKAWATKWAALVVAALLFVAWGEGKADRARAKTHPAPASTVTVVRVTVTPTHVQPGGRLLITPP